MRAWILVLATAGCLRTTQFHCDTSDQCGAGGACETGVGFCSFADSGCTGGRRFGPQAGDLANQCVGGMTGDARHDDAPSDTGSGGDANHCPSGYVTLPNATHRYKLITTGNDWASQRDLSCAATSAFAYLAIPDDPTELAAMDTFAGANSPYWIGVTDAGNGTFPTVKSGLQTFLPWDTGQPNNGPPPKNCVEVIGTTGTFADAKCGDSLPALCECE